MTRWDLRAYINNMLVFLYDWDFTVFSFYTLSLVLLSVLFIFIVLTKLFLINLNTLFLKCFNPIFSFPPHMSLLFSASSLPYLLCTFKGESRSHIHNQRRWRCFVHLCTFLVKVEGVLSIYAHFWWRWVDEDKNQNIISEWIFYNTCPIQECI